MGHYSDLKDDYTCICCKKINLDWSEMWGHINSRDLEKRSWLEPYVGGNKLCRICFNKLEKDNSKSLKK